MSEAHGAPMEERPLATRLEEAETLKTLGNDQYGKKNYAVAVTHYIDAISRLPARIDDGPGPEGEEDNEGGGNEGGDDGGAPSASEAEGAEVSTSATGAPRTPAEPVRTITLEEHLLSDETIQLRVKLYANLAACHLKLVRRGTHTGTIRRHHQSKHRRYADRLTQCSPKSRTMSRRCIAVRSRTKSSAAGRT